MRQILALTLLALAGPVLGGDGGDGGEEGESTLPPPHRVLRIDEDDAGIRIDGVLDEDVWGQATPLTGFRQSEPVAGAVPSERTEVRLLHDRRAIYVGLTCFDADPAGIRATQARRDANLDPDDRVELLFDTFHDRRSAFWFQIGPAGSLGDALLSRNGTEFNKEWDGIWSGRARITEGGWEAELRIPAATLSFDPAADDWGFNMRRFIRRRSEEVQWASPDPRLRFFSPSTAGVVEGMLGLEQGFGLDVRPFAVTDVRYEDDGGGYDVDFDAGVDAFHRLTPDAKLSLSLNTDFAETEADSRQVNLTRFPLFFPEKRDFFLEDSSNFFFGGGRRSRDVMPYFSRRIGINGEGGEVPLLAAAKITGRSESWSYGLLDVETRAAGNLDGRNLVVGRFSKNVLDQSEAGVIWTHGDPTGDTRRDTYGADFSYRTDRFRGDRNLQVSTYLLQTDTEDVHRDDTAFHADVAYPNDEVELSAEYTAIGSGFDPALGFVPRRGIKKYAGSFSWRPRLHSRIRRLEFGVYPTLITDTGNRTETVAVTYRPLKIQWESGDQLGFNVSDGREVLDEDFEIREGNVIAADTYGNTRYRLDFETSDKRALSLGIELSRGEFYDGTREDYQLGLDWRPSAAASVGLDYERVDVELPGGDFRVHVARARFDLQFGPDLAWMNFVQWDNQSLFLGLNSRLWWIPRAGQEVFLVVNQGWDADYARIAPGDGQVILKVGTTLRF